MHAVLSRSYNSFRSLLALIQVFAGERHSLFRRIDKTQQALQAGRQGGTVVKMRSVSLRLSLSPCCLLPTLVCSDISSASMQTLHDGTHKHRQTHQEDTMMHLANMLVYCGPLT